MVLNSQRVRSLLVQQIDKRLIVSRRMKDLSATVATIDNVTAGVPDCGPRRARHPHTLASSSGCQEMENVPVSSAHARGS